MYLHDSKQSCGKLLIEICGWSNTLFIVMYRQKLNINQMRLKAMNTEQGQVNSKPE